MEVDNKLVPSKKKCSHKGIKCVSLLSVWKFLLSQITVKASLSDIKWFNNLIYQINSQIIFNNNIFQESYILFI